MLKRTSPAGQEETVAGLPNLNRRIMAKSERLAILGRGAQISNEKTINTGDSTERARLPLPPPHRLPRPDVPCADLARPGPRARGRVGMRTYARCIRSSRNANHDRHTHGHLDHDDPTTNRHVRCGRNSCRKTARQMPVPPLATPASPRLTESKSAFL